jgi:hypothetical protein
MLDLLTLIFYFHRNDTDYHTKTHEKRKFKRFFRVEELRVAISSTEKINVRKTAGRCRLVDGATRHEIVGFCISKFTL